MKKGLLLLCALLSMNCIAQFSKTHYIPPLGTSQVAPAEQYLYISTPSTTPVGFRIIQIGSNDIVGTVSRDIPYVHNIGFGETTQLLVRRALVNTIRSDRGFIIEAEDLIYVTARVTAEGEVHAGEIVSKGLAALGTEFRIGAFTNAMTDSYGSLHFTFVSIMATENNTTVQFSDIDPGVTLLNNGVVGNTPAPIVLNSGQTFVLGVEGPDFANREGLLGALVSSDKPIVVNCGYFGGTNGAMNNLDLGFDQIVSAERTGTDYIFIKATGLPDVEKVLIIAHEDNTDVFLSGDPNPAFSLNAGEHATLNGTNFTSDGNLYVRTSKNTFAYQSVGNGLTTQANQEMFFVPPLSCETPKIIDNIPYMDMIGDRSFVGRVTIVTETGSDLEFVVNSDEYTLAGLPAAFPVVGPTAVAGNPDYETYTINNLYGHVSIKSTGQLYLASYGSDGAATFGGFYSGFTFKPEIAFDKLDTDSENCIPNIVLSISPLMAFDEFQWFFNDALIPGATSRNYTPTDPGYYHVAATISACGTTLLSDKIPVSACPDDIDDDTVNDNIDIDNDNDGIANCTESSGNHEINFTNPNGGTITAPNYTNSFTTTLPAGTGIPSPTPFTGNSDGSFVTETTAGRGNSVIANFNFANPVSISMEYVTTADAADLITSKSGFIISVPVNKTITVLNPDNQLLIDTNYDGIYESGVTEFSSFELRFRLNSSNPLPAGTGTFQFRAYLAGTFRFTHINLDADETRASFRIVATCVPSDNDGDGIPDQIDFDSDNDGIPDIYESQSTAFTVLSNTDSNGDGLDEIFGAGIVPDDNDADGIPNYLDLDSDNNGIYDLVESGSNAPDNNNNGIIDGIPSVFGSNGLLNSLETSADSGALNNPPADSDADGIYDYVESDNDNDNCADVLEAGFTDDNSDGYLGNAAPPVVNADGIVTGSGGYSAPDPAYNLPTPIIIIAQPQPLHACEGESAVLIIETNADVTYQWQLSVDGINFIDIVDNGVYSGSATTTLTIDAVAVTMEGYEYRVQLNKAGNVCGMVSESTTLQLNPLPPATAQTLVQCDSGTAPDGLTLFNLAQADALFTASDPNYEIAYYESMADAEAETGALEPAYHNLTNPQVLIVRVTNSSTGCFNFSTLNLVGNLLPSPTITIQQCDTDGSEDGFHIFDLTDANIAASATQSITYYLNETDALLEQSPIANPESYVNAAPYTMQTIIARVDDAVTNNCVRFYLINIKVDPLPNILVNEELEPFVVCVNSTSFTTTLDAAFQDNSNPADYTYQWTYEGQEIPGATNATLTVTAEGLYTVEVTDAIGCSKTRFIPVISSSQAIIDEILVTELSEYNNINVTVTADSYGDYVYSLDYPSAFQTSNIFPNVSAGYHTVYVRDLNGCPITSQTVAVMGIPPFFTPNNDGFNDYWNIRGASEANLHSVVHIFDRFGKLIKQISPAGEGWDGTLNGYPLPSTDYWYAIFLADGRTFKGHFTLKR